MMVALLRVRNEDRWLEACLRSIWFCDKIVVLDDNSTDLTPNICREFRVEYFQKPYDKGYEEGPDREFLAVAAARYKPDWICSPDGDEIFLEDTWDRIKDALDDPDVRVIEALNLHLWDNQYTIRVDNGWGDQYRQRFWRFKTGKLTYEADHCSIPNEITERPFTRLGVRMLHYGNFYASDRMRRYLRYVQCGHDWPTLIQGDEGGPPEGDMQLVSWS